MLEPLILFTGLLVVVLAISGVAKLRDPGAARDGFGALDVPSALAQPWMIAALPWVEIGLALGLLVTGGVLFAAIGAAVLLLFLAYLVLVVRVVAKGADASCGCFGSLTEGKVTGWTVARNAGYVVAALVNLAAALAGPAPLLVWLLGAGAGTWSWLIAAALVAVMAALTVYERPSEAAIGSPTPALTDEEGPDYVRLPIPFGSLRTQNGDVLTLRTLARTRAQLLFFVSPGCGSCQDIIGSVNQWQLELPVLSLHLVVANANQVQQLPADVRASTLLDEEFNTARLFESRGTPWAVLLGTDELLAAGPLSGTAQISELIEQLKDQLAEAESLS